MTSLDITPFLERIEYQGSTEANLETLQALQRAFLLTVPFENLDIHFDEKIGLSFVEFYDKIVNYRRGGISYECNGLFYAMLSALGYEVQLLSARIVLGAQLSPEFDHMVLLVKLDQDYLVDVGNGQSCSEPMAINSIDEYFSEKGSYRLGIHEGDHALFYKFGTADWQPRFVFSLEPRALIDFAPMFRFHQSSEDSVFTLGQLVTLMTATGRITLNGMNLITVDGDSVEQRQLSSQDECFECLKTYFDIDLDL